MKHLLTTLGALCLAIATHAQTGGTLTLTFTQTPHTSYSGSKNVMAVWIQDASGNFVKTRTRNVGLGTKDHLPTWAVNSGGSATNSTSSACNVVGASTGATYTSFTTRTVTWDGTDVSGIVIPDGTYKIIIESTWNHGSTGTTKKILTFTKGPTTDSQTPADDANFTSVSLDWVPAGAADLEEITVSSPEAKIYPNPSITGTFTVEYTNANELTVIDLSGKVVFEQVMETPSGTVELPLENLPNGNYILHLTNGENSIEEVISISK